MILEGQDRRVQPNWQSVLIVVQYDAFIWTKKWNKNENKTHFKINHGLKTWLKKKKKDNQSEGHSLAKLLLELIF